MKSGASDPFGDESEDADETTTVEEAEDIEESRGDAEGARGNAEGTRGHSERSHGDTEETADDIAELSSDETTPLSSAVETSDGYSGDDGHSSGNDDTGKSRSGGSGGTTTGGNGGELDRSQIPYTLRRDNVKDERPHVHQLFVTDDTDDDAREVERDLEDLLGTDVYRLDAREAIYRIGMEHPEEVAELLEEWGYNF